MNTKKETRTYKITGSAEILNRIERFLSVLHLNGRWGHSGTFCMHFDGDGHDTVNIGGIDHDKNKDEVNALSGCGGNFEIIGDYGAFCVSAKADAKEVYNPKNGNMFKSLNSGDIMGAQSKILFFKSYVKPHTRKLADGRVIHIGGYNNKKLAHEKGKDSKTKDMFSDKNGSADSRIPDFDVKNATQDAADKWIAEMHKKGLLYHFDDNPDEVINKDGRVFTDEEGKKLGPIIDAIFDIKDYDPFDTVVKLSNE